MTDLRPLSPHLSIHKKLLTSIFSISHRITGIFLSLGSILLILWIMLIALGPNYYFIFDLISKNFIFKILLFFWSLSIFYHLFNGIRYLFWSYGQGMSLSIVHISSYIVLFATILSTFLVWYW
tara:strand:- start:240 stop:608 length:369 start_codon:yes stop_codon:yes gene_type:complete